MIGKILPSLLGATILASVAAAQSAPPATPPPVEEKKICRSEAEIGSLVKKRRTCLTREQWKYVDDQHSAEARKMLMDNTNRQVSN